MRRLIATAVFASAMLVPTAFAQSTTETINLADQSPSANVRGAAVRARRPGSWIDQARARHTELMNERLNAARFGAGSSSAETGTQSNGGTNTGSIGGIGIDDLLDLANQFGGIGNIAGSLGGIGDIDSLLGGLGGTGGSTITTPSDGSNNGAAGGATITSLGGNRSQVRNDPDEATFDDSGKLPTDRAQVIQDEEPKFSVRLADSLLNTFFTAVAIAMQTQEFVDVLKDFLRPIFAPQPVSDEAGDGTGGAGSPGDGNLEDLGSGGSDGTSPGDSIVLGFSRAVVRLV